MKAYSNSPVTLAIAGLLSLAACKAKRPPRPDEPPPTVAPATSEDADEARLLGLPSASASSTATAPVEVLGLHVGDSLGPVTISDILPLEDGHLPVMVRASQGDGTLEVTLRGEGPLPPATTELFAVYWRHGPTPGVPDALLNQAAQALAKRIAANEATLLPPPGMRAYGKVKPPGH